MHSEALEFVEEFARGRRFRRVVEFGSRDVNGTVRDVIEADRYIGIDIAPGPGVDVVCDAGHYRGATYADLVVCCETLEHAPNVEQIVAAARQNLCYPRGWFVMTCAADPREPHSAVDGGPLRDGEHYANVDAGVFAAMLGRRGFVIHVLRQLDRGDLQVIAERVR